MGLAKVRPDERRGAVAAFLTLFGILAGHTLLETARDALFLARLPAVAAALGLPRDGASSPSSSPRARGARRARRAGARRSPSCSSSAPSSPSSSGCSAGRRTRWALRALYVWTGILGTLSALQFWMVLGELYTRRPRPSASTGWWAPARCWARSRAPAIARDLSTRASGRPALVLASAIVLALTAIGPAMRCGAPGAGGGPRRRPRAVARARPCACCAAIPT